MRWLRGREPIDEYRRVADEVAESLDASNTLHDAQMRWAFEITALGLVEFEPDPDYPGFAQALADSAGSLSPNGTTPALSTYWVDRCITWASRYDDPTTTAELSSGNTTVLLRRGDSVVAESLYELFEPEMLPAREVIAGLVCWRRAILERIAACGADLPDTGRYWAQRNPGE